MRHEPIDVVFVDVKPGTRLRVELFPDDASGVECRDDICQITYNSRSRYVLGNAPSSGEEDADIAAGVSEGTYIGIPVWAYVHSGATVQAAQSNPFSCTWDSGRSGWAYVTKKQAKAMYGTTDPAKVVEALIADVSMFNDYLTGDIGGFVTTRIDTDASGAETEEELDSCWGFVPAKAALDQGLGEAKATAREIVKAEGVQLELLA